MTDALRSIIRRDRQHPQQGSAPLHKSKVAGFCAIEPLQISTLQDFRQGVSPCALPFDRDGQKKSG